MHKRKATKEQRHPAFCMQPKTWVVFNTKGIQHKENCCKAFSARCLVHAKCPKSMCINWPCKLTQANNTQLHPGSVTEPEAAMQLLYVTGLEGESGV